jgi:hypothetical protein
VSRDFTRRLAVALNDLEGASYRHGTTVRNGADYRHIENARAKRMEARKVVVDLVKTLVAPPSESPSSSTQVSGPDQPKKESE